MYKPFDPFEMFADLIIRVGIVVIVLSCLILIFG